MFEGKPQFKPSISGINDTVARKIARSKFKESFNDLIYNKGENRYDLSIKVDLSGMSDKEKKKLKDEITAFENDKEWKNTFKVEILNKIEL